MLLLITAWDDPSESRHQLQMVFTDPTLYKGYFSPFIAASRAHFIGTYPETNNTRRSVLYLSTLINKNMPFAMKKILWGGLDPRHIQITPRFVFGVFFLPQNSNL